MSLSKLSTKRKSNEIDDDDNDGVQTLSARAFVEKFGSDEASKLPYNSQGTCELNKWSQGKKTCVYKSRYAVQKETAATPWITLCGVHSSRTLRYKLAMPTKQHNMDKYKAQMGPHIQSVLKAQGTSPDWDTLLPMGVFLGSKGDSDTSLGLVQLHSRAPISLYPGYLSVFPNFFQDTVMEGL